MVAFFKSRPHETLFVRCFQLRAEVKLAVVGIILTILTALYALFCGSMAVTCDLDRMARMRKYEYIIGDVYSWINPYLLLACSQPVRKHFCKILSRHENVYKAVEMEQFGKISVNGVESCAATVNNVAKTSMIIV